MTERRKEILRVLSKDFSIKTVRAFGKEASDYFNRSKLVLNIHAEEYLDTETRVYEALGSGACLVSEKLSEENPFIPGEHYVEASSLDQLKLRLEYYLTHEKERQKIAETGHREASTRHTYAGSHSGIGEAVLLSANKGWCDIASISGESALRLFHL